MPSHTYETVVATSPGRLYAAIVDLRSWPVWDPEIERILHDGALHPGARFTLRPKGGPNVKMTVEEALAGRRFSDLAQLPLAKMRTRHDFEPLGEGTRLRVTIEVFGPLAFLWDRLVAQKQVAGLERQVSAFVRFADERK